MKTNWQAFAMLADSFLIAYAEQSASSPPATLFTVGHAAELYLKACLLKANPLRNVVNQGHEVGDMLREVQDRTPPLLDAYRLRPSASKYIGICPVTPALAADPDYEHFVKHQELFWVTNCLSDIKYLGTIHTNRRAPQNAFAMNVCSQNPYWLPFFKEARNHLGWPIQGACLDPIAIYLARRQALPHAKAWLAQL